MTRAEITARLTGDRGQPLKELSWWSRLDAALADPVVRVVVLWLMRQSGKTQALMVRAIGDLLLLAGAFTLFVSAGREQAETLFRRKCRLPLLRLLRAAGIPPATFRTTKTVIENLTTGAALEVVSPNELTVPSRSVSLLVIDEARYVSDEVFAALAPSVIGAGGKILLASTAGKPSGFFHDLATRPDPEVAVIRVDGNENPYADPTIIGFLGRLLGRLLPVAAKRDLDNLFAEDGDRYIPGPLWTGASRRTGLRCGPRWSRPSLWRSTRRTRATPAPRSA